MKTLKSKEIYTFKLLTGEEIVARVESVQDDCIMIEHPILCVLTAQGLQMMPGLFSSDQAQTVRLNNSSWAMIAETREDIRSSWIQATTGITPVSRQIITG